MRDLSKDPMPSRPEPRITLIAINQSYWMFEGEEFLNAMLLGRGAFPLPVRCIRFASPVELRAFVGKDRLLTDLWGINPDIVDRLRRDDQIVDVLPPPV